MSILQHLVAFTLRQVLGEAAEAVGQAVAGRFLDPSQALPKAIARAGERTWQGLAVALAGDGLLDRVKVFFARGEDKGLREQLRLFLETTPGLPLTAPEVRRLCLAELKELRQAGLLAVDRLRGEELGRQTATLARYAEPQQLLNGAWTLMGRLAEQLAPNAPNLAALLGQRTANGPPLLVAIFSFFLRREVTRDEELRDELFFDQLHSLIAAQRKGFAQLDDALQTLGGQLEKMLDELAGIRMVVDETHAVVIRLESKIEELAQRNHIRPGDLGRLVVTINNAQEQEVLRRLRDEYRQLPPEQQNASHLLLLGDSLNAAGLFGLAQKSHEEAARRAAKEKQTAQVAEASFKEYRSACEQALWAEALPALLRAARLDPERFAPFPLQRYAVQGILGSGGFGTVFLCQDAFFKNRSVAVKSLHGVDLERSLDEVFGEAHALTELNHPNIIGVFDCSYADLEKRRRPYIVMPYLPCVSLEEYLRQQKKPFPLSTGLRLLRQLALGMQAAHRRGIWHRDLKPANILLPQADGGGQLKIIDFGLAVQEQAARYSVARPAAQRSRQERSYAGTWDYAPPEQRGKSSEPVGPYSDVYSFGKTACEALLLTNEPRIADLKRLPAALAELLDRCIAPARKDRPQTFDEVLPILEAVLDELDPAKQRQRQEAERQRQAAEEAKRQAHLRQEEEARRQQEAAKRQAEEARRQAEAAAAERRRKEEEARQQEAKRQVEGQARRKAEAEAEERRRREEEERQRLPARWTNPTLNAPFALIPAGTAWLGGGGGTPGTEQVTIAKAFYLGVYPVTQAQWQTLMGNNPSWFSRTGGGSDKLKGWFKAISDAELQQFPVEQVSRQDAQAFLKKLNERERNSGWLYRLPTAAEWEYACRGGPASREVSAFHFYFDKPTNDLSSELANFDDTYPVGSARKGKYLKRTSRVGLYPANALGLHDMHGNVWEMCEIQKGRDRVFRGGCWLHDGNYCTAAHRGDLPTYRDGILGFRLARVSSGSKA